MWWRIVLAALAGLVSLVMVSFSTHVLTVHITLPAGSAPPAPVTIAGVSPIFLIAEALVVLLALPLLIYLLQRWRRPR